SRVQHRLGGFRGDISTHLGLESRVFGGRVEHRETLARAGGAVQVQPGGRGARRAPAPRQLVAVAHLTESESPKSPASSVHHPVRRNPAPANSAFTPSGWNLHDTSVSISSPAANSTVKSSAPTRTRWAHSDRSHISMRSSSVFQRATCR